jgi:hypothetical protein
MQAIVFEAMDAELQSLMRQKLALQVDLEILKTGLKPPQHSAGPVHDTLSASIISLQQLVKQLQCENQQLKVQLDGKLQSHGREIVQLQHILLSQAERSNTGQQEHSTQVIEGLPTAGTDSTNNHMLHVEVLLNTVQHQHVQLERLQRMCGGPQQPEDHQHELVQQQLACRSAEWAVIVEKAAAPHVQRAMQQAQQQVWCPCLPRSTGSTV